jgi:G3E family GTPase
MKLAARVAIFYVALSALSTMATAQSVYKCGNAYSQKPCADAVVLDVQDSRTPAQKAESDALIKRDSAAANAMEKTRLKEEAQQRADNAKLAAAAAKRAPVKSKEKAAKRSDGKTDSHKTSTAKKSVKKKQEPEHFSARSAAEKPKHAASAAK